jgi:hypothetical protein
MDIKAAIAKACSQTLQIEGSNSKGEEGKAEHKGPVFDAHVMESKLRNMGVDLCKLGTRMANPSTGIPLNSNHLC